MSSLLPDELFEAVLVFLSPATLASVENTSLRMRIIVARAACRILATVLAPACAPSHMVPLPGESWACIARFAAQLQRARQMHHRPVVAAAGTMVSGCYCLVVGTRKTWAQPSSPCSNAVQPQVPLPLPRHQCATKHPHSLWSWGHGGWGRLGHGDTQRKGRPTLVRALLGEDIVATAAHAGYAAAVTAEGALFTWGDAVGGRLGHEGLLHGQLWVPRRVHQPCMDRQRVISVACGGSHALALCERGSGSVTQATVGEAGLGASKRTQLWAWGSNCGGTLGLGLTEAELAIATAPREVPPDFAPDAELVQVAAGVSCSAAVSGCGCVFTWGMGTHGRLGHGGTDRSTRAAGSDRGGAATASGTVGTGDFASQTVPHRVEVLAAAGARIVHIAAGSYHMLAVSDTGQLWAWGGGDYGQLGLGEQQNQPLPLQVIFDAPGGDGNTDGGASGHGGNCATNTDEGRGAGEGAQIVVVSVSAGAEHSAALDATGALWTWGSAADGGQLGHGDRQCRLRPKRCTALEHERITHVSCAQAGHSIALSSSGQLWTWGCGLGGGQMIDMDSNVHVGSMLPIPLTCTADQIRPGLSVM